MVGNESAAESAFAAPLSSLGLYAARVTSSVVGRARELAAIEQEFEVATRRMSCLTLEGEPGVGKTRLLVTIEELARQRGFAPVAVTADEEIRGPFLLARSIFAAPALQDAAEGTAAESAFERAAQVLAGDQHGIEGLSPDRQLVRALDLAAVALRALAEEQPLALLLDDLQWADEDSLRLLRYIVRTAANSPILLVFSLRSDELASVEEAVTLLADTDRMGILRRLKLVRFTQLESVEFLSAMLGGPLDANSGATMHAQAEGVPFILAEQAHTYRDTGLLNQVDGVWRLARNAQRLLPSAVRTLIQRRVARLPEAAGSVLGDAAVLGRSFSLRDVSEARRRLGEPADADQLAQELGPACDAGLLVARPDHSAADYSFTHERIREYALAALTAPRRRSLHAAVVEMLTAGGDPPSASLALLAQHALDAELTEDATRFAIAGARAALEVHAADEALRLVELVQSVAAGSTDRVALLSLRDDALGMLRRPVQRLEGLAELSALAEALGDEGLQRAVMLRRASALRLAKDEERAAELARRARELAAEQGDEASELAACIELGQDLLRSESGEAYVPVPSESDLDGATEAYEHAAELAERLGDDAALAAATRELGVIAVARLRAWVVEHMDVARELRRIAASGESYEEYMAQLPAAEFAARASDCFHRALETYERLGDRQGSMATVIAMAFETWGPEIHVTGGAGRIEELRRLMTRMKSFTTESERARADAQMLYGTHVYARAKGFPDVALTKGQEAFHAARTIGDRALEFSSAGGVAMSFAEMGAITEAEDWCGRAAAVASEAPSPLRTRVLEAWRGMVCSAAGDAVGMRSHLERALKLAEEQPHPAARCEALARMAVEAARLFAATPDDESLGQLADDSARAALAAAAAVPGRPPWAAQSHAALARTAFARGDREAALASARAALAAFTAAENEDLHLEILLPAAEAILSDGSEEEIAEVRGELRIIVALIAQRLLDQDVRARWFQGPAGRALTRLAGTTAPELGPEAAPEGAGGDEAKLLTLLAQGLTNGEIAEQLGESEAAVGTHLAELYARIGASSRAEATALALVGRSV